MSLKVIPIPRPEELREFAGKITDKDIPVLVSAIRSNADLLRPPFQREPDFGVTSVNYDFAELLSRAETPS